MEPRRRRRRQSHNSTADPPPKKSKAVVDPLPGKIRDVNRGLLNVMTEYYRPFIQEDLEDQRFDPKNNPRQYKQIEAKYLANLFRKIDNLRRTDKDVQRELNRDEIYPEKWIVRRGLLHADSKMLLVLRAFAKLSKFEEAKDTSEGLGLDKVEIIHKGGRYLSKTIAQRSGLSEDNVKRHIRAMEDTGILTRHHFNKKKFYLSCGYWLNNGPAKQRRIYWVKDNPAWHKILKGYTTR